MEQKSNTFLGTENVGHLMRKYAIPCIISLLVAALYNIIDQIFIANANYLGSYGNAANTVVYPMTVLALGFASIIGDGCCAFVSICQGEGREEDAHKSIGNAILLCLMISIVLMIIYLTCADPILTLFGGRVNDRTFALSKQYFFYISLGIPFYMFGQAMNPIIRSDGSPKFAMACTLAGCVTNVILDPIFIYVFRWGMMGAAIATVAGQVITAIVSIWYLCHMKTVKLRKKSFGFYGKLMKRFLPLGITSLLTQASIVISMAVMQNVCTKYGAMDPIFGQAEYAQIPLAVLGIVMKFFQIVLAVSIGLAAGCVPIVGYNIGARRKDRAKHVFTYLLIGEAVTGAVALFIAEVFPGQLIGLFGAANESVYYTEFAIRSFRTYLCTMILATVNRGTFIYLQAMGKAVTSSIISLMREVVFGVGFALLLPVFFGLTGLLYSFPAADILTFVIALIIIVRTYKELSTVDTAAV